MNRLTAFGVYYIVIGVAAAFNLAFFGIYRLIYVGLFVILIDWVLRRLGYLPFKAGRFSNFTKAWVSVFLGAFPFLLLLSIFLVFNGPFYKSIILPDGYTGLVHIEYSVPDGDPIEWGAGIPHIGADRIIRVGDDGRAFSQARHASEFLPLPRGTWGGYIRDNTRIYYASDTERQVVRPGQDQYINYAERDSSRLSVFTIGAQYPTQTFVIDVAGNYCKYFLGVAPEHRSGYRQDEYVNDTCIISPFTEPNDSFLRILTGR